MSPGAKLAPGSAQQACVPQSEYHCHRRNTSNNIRLNWSNIRLNRCHPSGQATRNQVQKPGAKVVR